MNVAASISSAHESFGGGLAAVLESRRWSGGHPALWTRAGVATWDDLARMYARQLEEHRGATGQRWGLAMRADAASIASLAALERLRCDVFLLDGELAAERVAELASRFELRRCLGVTRPGKVDDRDAGEMARGVDPSAVPTATVTILTSGTSGQVKAVRHDWTGLARPVRRVAEGSAQRWLLAFRPHLYAGLQVLLQALLNGGTLVAPGPRDDPNQIARLMADARVEFASATPSYWRRLVLWADPALLDQLVLRQITLGGEAVDQDILDRLHRAFPSARLVHIYATTELGRCFSVTDGQSGFPISYLQGPSAEGVELQVRGQELHVRSANAMRGYIPMPDAASLARADEDGWFPTGDLVEVAGDRVRFAGRSSDMINVGGNKVYPLLVEKVIREEPGVADVRVFGQSSSIAGQLVACQIVPAAGEDAEQLRDRVLQRCRTQLDRYQCPRVVLFVDRLELTSAGKIQRSAAPESS